MTEWDNGSWCQWPSLPVEQHCKDAMSVQSHVGTLLVMTSDVVRVENPKKQAVFSQSVS